MNRIFSALLAASLSIATAFAGPYGNTPPNANQVADYTGYIGVTRSLNLLEAFTDPDATNAVRVATKDYGNIDIVLFGYDAPITVANFLRYVDEGRYFYPDPRRNNQLAPPVIHQSVYDSAAKRPVTLQAGAYFGFAYSTTDNTWLPAPISAAGTALPPIKNEYNGVLSNETATVAMAVDPAVRNANGTIYSGGPDSATSEWFINLSDNGGPPEYLNGNGTDAYPPHCVFGRVIESTFTNALAIATLPRFNFSGSSGQSALASVPLRNYTTSDYNAYLAGDATKSPKVDTNVITMSSISQIPPMNFTASIDNPAIADVALSGTFLHITPKQAGAAKITVTATDLDGAQVTQSFSFNTATAPGRLVNISTRMQVGTGENVLIGGFIVRGTSDSATKRLLVRGIGPSLSSQAVANPLADPLIELHDSSGAVVATNDNWQVSYAATNAVKDTGVPPASGYEAALLATVPATTGGSAYTVVLKGVNDGTGVGLVEIYDLDYGPGSTALNISTRGKVDTGENVMIGGFFIGGNDSKKILVRGIGPSLSSQGVSGALADPQLELRNAQGTLLDSNDDWQSSSHKSDIQATGVPPGNPKEAALYEPGLAPGAYTAILRGGGVTPTGVALVEIYQL